MATARAPKHNLFKQDNSAVLLLHNEYGASKSDISSINRQLAGILKKHRPDIPVFCTVLEATEEDKQDAQRDGVVLLLPKCNPDDHRKASMDWLTFDHYSKYPHLPSTIRSIVGHADITSRAAVRIKKERHPDADVILFIHDIPEETGHCKRAEEIFRIWEKEDSILQDAQEADVVFSLGNKIFDHFNNQFRAIPSRMRPQHFKFVPRPSKPFEDAEAEYKDTETMVVLSIGRVKGVHKLEGLDLACSALSIVAEKRKVKWRVRTVNQDDFQASKTILECCKSANLQISPLPFGTQKDICKDMMQANLVLIPSRAEPFGLIGLEAIAAGVPVLVSNKSGLADFIDEHIKELHHSIVDMNESEDGASAKRWAENIESMLKYNSIEFETAARCKKKLLSTKYWEESHQLFLNACTDAGNSWPSGSGGSSPCSVGGEEKKDPQYSGSSQPHHPPENLLAGLRQRQDLWHVGNSWPSGTGESSPCSVGGDEKKDPQYSVFSQPRHPPENLLAGPRPRQQGVPQGIAALNWQRVSRDPGSQSEYTVVMVGWAGCGKSRLANSILGRYVFKYSAIGSVTCKKLSGQVGDIRFNVIDTPCVINQNTLLEQTLKEISKCHQLCPNGINALLLVIRFGQRFTKKEEFAIEQLKMLFGDNLFKYGIIIFTGWDDFEIAVKTGAVETFKDYLRAQPPYLQEILRKVDQRYVLFNSRLTGVEANAQRDELIKMIHAIRRNVGGVAYRIQTVPLESMMDCSIL